MARLFITLLLLVVASCSPRTYIDKVTTDRSIDTSSHSKIEVNYTPREVIVLTELPKERVETTTNDSTSRLETSVAISTASMKDGKLHHTLENKSEPIEHMATVFDKETVKDNTTNITNSESTQTEVVKEVYKLRWWQTILCWVGAIALFILIYKILKIPISL